MAELFPTTVSKSAVFSKDRTHRFSLSRIWDHSKPCVMFIGLNPSTADGKENDNTIDSVQRMCIFNGYGGFYMMNCFSFISTNPDGLVISEEESSFNNIMLRETAEMCAEVVFAWGAFKVVKKTGRGEELNKMFPKAKCLEILKDGSPKHPLYCKRETQFIPYAG